jgi:hypothetical protein
VPLYEAQRTVDGITAKLWLSTNRRDNRRRRSCLGSSLPHLSERSGALRREALPPALPATPHPRRSESEAFRNSRRRGPTTRGGSVSPSFLLTSSSVGPRSSGKVRSEPRQALLSSQRIIGMLRFHLRTQRRKTHQPAFADLLLDEGIAAWP